MKNILLFFIFLLFLDGVFGESLSVMEGDSVTLHTELTEIQKNHVIEWRFGDGSDLIAKINRPANTNKTYDDDLGGKFKHRLKLQEQNGDLTIINIRTTDSGDYKVTISSKTKIFNVKVVSADAVKSVIVNEGDSVNLRTGLTEIQRDDVNHVIRWRFAQQKSPVAEINSTAGIFNTYDGPDGRFRGRLRLDHQTGSLNITNITATHSGLYEVEISRTSSRYTIHKSFNVTVRDAVKPVSVKEGETVTLQTVTEIQKDDEIQWMIGETVIAEIYKASQPFYKDDGDDGRFRDRLKLDHQTGSLTITNTRTTDSGDYKLVIRSSRHLINSRITVTVTGSDLHSGLNPRSGSGLSPAAVAGIVGVVVLLAAAVVAAVVKHYRSKISELERRREENGQNLKTQETCVPANEETKLQ